MIGNPEEKNEKNANNGNCLSSGEIPHWLPVGGSTGRQVSKQNGTNPETHIHISVCMKNAFLKGVSGIYCKYGLQIIGIEQNKKEITNN